MIRGWDPIVAGRRWLNAAQPFSDQSMGVGFHTVRGSVDPGNRVFRPRLVGRVYNGGISDPGMGTYPPRVWRGLDDSIQH